MEYQKLVQTICKQTDTENHRMKHDLVLSRNQLAQQKSDSDSQREKLQNELKEARAQFNELQAFRTRIQSTCSVE